MEGKKSVTRQILKWGCLLPTIFAIVAVVAWVLQSRAVLQRAEHGRAAIRVGMPAADAMKAALLADLMSAHSDPDAQGNSAQFTVHKEGESGLVLSSQNRPVTPGELADMIKKDGRIWTASFIYLGTPRHSFSVKFTPQGIVESISPLSTAD